MGTRPCLHGHHGRDAADFGPVPGARSAVDWTSTSDERQGNRPKAARPFGLRRKSPFGSSKRSTVLPDTLFAFLLPQDDFRAQRGSRGLCKQGLNLGLEGPETVREALGAKKRCKCFGVIACPCPLSQRHSMCLRQGIGGEFPHPKLVGLWMVHIKAPGGLVF